jgi:alkaline phosphatase D
MFSLRLASILLAGTGLLAQEPPQEEAAVERVLFGSCNQQDRPAPIWEAVAAREPDVFVLLGDNVYGDTLDMDVLRRRYAELEVQPGFAALRASCRLLAIWDDHDYGADDAGAEYERKHESQEVFGDFFEVPEDSPRRARAGIYDAVVIGPPQAHVQVVLLDTRTFRSPLRTWPESERPAGRGPYRPHEPDDEDPTLLGEAQWRWLEGELRRPAELRIVASSIQVIADEHGYETWGNFPAERRRFYGLIASTEAAGVLFVSGDRHLAEISRVDPAESGVGYPLHDVTASSLNKPTLDDVSGEPNRHRLGANHPAENFGSIEIDWAEDDPRIELSVRDLSGAAVNAVTIRLSALQP